MKDDRVYLAHILDCIGKVEEYTKDGRENFLSSSLKQDAVVRNLQIMAQSASRVYKALKSAHHEVDWQGLRAFRNVLVHDYLSVSYQRVWRIVESELPPLKEAVARMLDELGGPPEG